MRRCESNNMSVYYIHKRLQGCCVWYFRVITIMEIAWDTGNHHRSREVHVRTTYVSKSSSVKGWRKVFWSGSTSRWGFIFMFFQLISTLTTLDESCKRSFPCGYSVFLPKLSLYHNNNRKPVRITLVTNGDK